MAVRFEPPPHEESSRPNPDRTNLAEVIELRGMLTQQVWRSGTHSLSSDDEGREGSSASDATGHGRSDEEAPAEVIALHDRSVASQIAEARVQTDAVETARRPGVSEGSIDDAVSVRGSSSGRSAYEDGVRLLARKAKSSGELREELLRQGHDTFEVDAVIDEFERGCYLDDLGLARAQTEKLRDVKRASRSQIRVKLRARRLPDSVIEEALGELDDSDEFALLRETAVNRASKLSGLDRQTAERRLLGFLARRGWSGEPAMRAVRDALDGASGGPSHGGGVRFR